MAQSKIDIPEFFTKEELAFFKKWAYRVYDKGNPKHTQAKNFLMETVWAKTAYWADELVARLRGFQTLKPRMWSERGWDDSSGKNKRVSRFKNYTWARIFKSKDRGRDIFFTVGVQPEARSLLYKIDFYGTKQSTLSASQRQLCKQLIPDEVKWMEIPYEKVIESDWDELLDQTDAFVRDNESVYDQIIRSVWKGTVNVSKLTNRLIKRDTPKHGIDSLPVRKFPFKGHDTDWEKKGKQNKRLGALGEKLVMKYEQDFLEKKGLLKFSREVRKAKDGEGFDVFSRLEDGSPKYIEVKSTTGPEDTSFPISQNEIEFSKSKATGYFLYRLFNLKRDTKVAEFHEYSGELEGHFLFEGIQFLAHRKKKKS